MVKKTIREATVKPSIVNAIVRLGFKRCNISELPIHLKLAILDELEEHVILKNSWMTISPYAAIKTLVTAQCLSICDLPEEDRKTIIEDDLIVKWRPQNKRTIGLAGMLDAGAIDWVRMNYADYFDNYDDFNHAASDLDIARNLATLAADQQFFFKSDYLKFIQAEITQRFPDSMQDFLQDCIQTYTRNLEDEHVQRGQLTSSTQEGIDVEHLINSREKINHDRVCDILQNSVLPIQYEKWALESEYDPPSRSEELFSRSLVAGARTIEECSHGLKSLSLAGEVFPRNILWKRLLYHKLEWEAPSPLKIQTWATKQQTPSDILSWCDGNHMFWNVIFGDLRGSNVQHVWVETTPVNINLTTVCVSLKEKRPKTSKVDHQIKTPTGDLAKSLQALASQTRGDITTLNTWVEADSENQKIEAQLFTSNSGKFSHTEVPLADVKINKTCNKGRKCWVHPQTGSETLIEGAVAGAFRQKGFEVPYSEPTQRQKGGDSGFYWCILNSCILAIMFESYDHRDHLHKDMFEDIFYDGLRLRRLNLPKVNCPITGRTREKARIDEHESALSTVHQRTVAQIEKNLKTILPKYLSKYAIPRTCFGKDLTPANMAGVVMPLFESLGMEKLISLQIYRAEKKLAVEERGWPDLALWNSKNFLFLEVKGPTDKLWPHQKARLDDLNALGIPAHTLTVTAAQ